MCGVIGVTELCLDGGGCSERDIIPLAWGDELFRRPLAPGAADECAIR
jgi:hypothetical protein